MRRHISGREATYMAIESDRRAPVKIEPLPEGGADNVPSTTSTSAALAPANTGSVISLPSASRKKPPRLRKPSRNHDRCVAPTADLEEHRGVLRQAFGNTLSDEFAEVMLGKLITALRPGPFDHLDEATLNAAIALIASVNPQTELQALIAVQIAATGFAGLKFLRQSQHHMDEIYIDVYGSYAAKLFRLQLEMIHTLDRHQRGNKQTVEVRHVHIHSGAQGVVGIVNTMKNERGMVRNDTRPHASGGHCATTDKFGQSTPVWGKNPRGPPLPSGGCTGPEPMSNARWGQRLGRPSGYAQWEFQTWASHTGSQVDPQIPAYKNFGDSGAPSAKGVGCAVLRAST